MKAGVSKQRQTSFEFVVDELFPLRPTIRQMFGFTYIYVEDKLLLTIRNSDKQPKFNGVWLYTQAEYLASLRREFPELPKRYFWKSGKNGWVIFVSQLEEFEEYVYRACALILNGDRRMGRITRRSWNKSKEFPVAIHQGFKRRD